MTLTKFALVSTVALGTLSIAAQANAADIYTPSTKDAPIVVVPPTWTGFYFGGHLGAAWSQIDTNKNTYYDGYHWKDENHVTYYGQSPFGGNNLNDQNAFGGGQFGYNWQTGGNFVFGIEVDIGGLGGENEKTFFGNTTYGSDADLQDVFAVRVKSEGGFYGDVTGRLGYAWGNTLLYAKGGFAWIQPELKVSVAAYDNNTGDTYGISRTFDDTLTGWTVGGGLEFLLNPNWSVKVEYLHYNFELDNNRWNWGDTDWAANSWKLFNNDLTIDTVKLGVNYKFGSAPVYTPLK
ncbi:outer membrane protein [Rhodomicrobium sp.]|uniref:outer membrane protein n=1 Tax=Rhodomicrobium sp. TaxID=2720632 RepID=UPI0039E2522D